MQVFLEETLLVNELKIADTFLARLKGLIFQEEMGEQEGLLLKPCNSVHTFFMKFNLDIIYLNKDLIIIDVFYNVPPGKVLPLNRLCHSVIEVKAGKLPLDQKLLNKRCFIN